MGKQKDFIHLSVRSDLSGIARSSVQDYAGAGRVQDYVPLAKLQGQSAIAITDLGSMRSAFTLKQECSRAGVKPIYGVEVYVCLNHEKRGLPPEVQEEITKGMPPSTWRNIVDDYVEKHGFMRKEFELTTLNLWAMNDEGLANLFRLTSKSWVDGFYFKPRVDVSMLREFSSGVAVGLGTANSWVHKPNLAGKRRLALDRFQELTDIYEKVLCEVRPHKTLVQSRCNDFAIELKGLKFNDEKVSLVATGGVHYLQKEHLPLQKMMCSIGSGKGSELSGSGLEIDSYWLRTRPEMLSELERCGFTPELSEQLCDAATEFGNSCAAEFKTDPFAMIIPDINTGELSHVEFLEKKCNESLRWTDGSVEFGPEREEYLDRLNSELEILAKPVSEGSTATFASYIVYVNEVIEMCRSLGIALGPGRGSAAGSIVNWLLGITDVDPVEHDLMFSRFIAPNRVGPPDVDIDIDPSKRPLLLEKMQERWGADCVGQISTFGKLKGRMVINDVARELKIPAFEVSKVSKYIDQRSDFEDGAFETVKEAFLTGSVTPEGEHLPVNADCRAFAEKYPVAIDYAVSLEGKVRQLGLHPAGIVCAPKPLAEYVPLETRTDRQTDERVTVTAFDMQGVDQCGLLKIDMLSLVTVGVIANAIIRINEETGAELSMSNIPLDDEATLKAFEDRDFVGVFQFDSNSAKKLCKGVTFPSFGTISDMTALNRPGPLDSGMAEKYIERKADPSLVEMDYCPLVSEITKDTLGIMIYQEQVMKVCGEVGLHENPDAMRKIIGKKLMDKIEAERPGFVEGAGKSSPEMSEVVANKLFSDIVTFGRYGFNKSHSVAYGKIGYLCQYLKVHHPLEFFWSLMHAASLGGKNDMLRRYAKEAAKRGIKLLPPNVSKSGFALGIDRDRNAIIGALTDVKGVGKKAGERIVSKQPFSSFVDFMERADGKGVNKGSIVALAQAGAFNDLLSNIKGFIDNAEFLFKERKLKRFKGWEEELALVSEGADYTDEEKVFWNSEVNPMALENPYTSMLRSMPMDIKEFTSKTFFEDHDGETIWVSGSARSVRIYQDTGFGDKPMSDAEKEHESYGKDYANGSLEADDGTAVKFKANAHIFDGCKDFMTDDEPLLMSARVDMRYQTLRPVFIASLRRLKMEEKHSVAERIVLGQSPLPGMKSLSPSEVGYATQDVAGRLELLHAQRFEALPVIGVVTAIKTKLSGKKLQEMAWLNVLASDGTAVEVTVFSSDWLGGSRFGRMKPSMKGLVDVGSVIRIDVQSNEYNGRFSCQYAGSGLKVFA